MKLLQKVSAVVLFSLLFIVTLFSSHTGHAIDQSNVLSANTSEQAIEVKVRVEGWESTIIPLTELEVEPYDITDVVGNNEVGNWYKNNDTTLAIHAIIKALENEGMDVTDPYVIDVAYNGNYIAGIANEWEGDQGPASGWMYKLNGVLPSVGVGQQTLADQDVIEFFYIGHYNTYDFGQISASDTNIQQGEDVKITVEGQPASWGEPLPFESIEQATLVINGNSTTYTTDANGEVTISFTEPGKYEITASKFGPNSYNLVRPVPITIVVE
ncbi:DUF4430 domain-containing protein [Longirhabdus pacifica]|uniref:DUF4430 domain-containing protein n=1 Tax=Longirhabdus pacifica TaxID=2305227 RepID=UPI0013E8DA98|nr:DUF4430 domain-containing protein [Longirhabdus pacifica]